MQESRRFKRTLPSPYDHDLLSLEQTQITMLGGMRRKGRGQVFKYCRPPGEGADSTSNYYVSRIECSAVVQGKLKAIGRFLDAPDLTPVHIRHYGVLEPVSIIDKAT